MTRVASITTDQVTIAAERADVRCFFARPDSPGPHPGVVVIHDITGSREDTRRHCRRFAEVGYVAVAPDLYDGYRPRCVVRTLANLVAGRAPAELEAVRGWLGAHEAVDAERLAITGFCMGGGFALAAASCGAYTVAGPFYGSVPLRAEALRGVCPTIAQAGSQDLVFSSAARMLDRHLDKLGVPHEVHVHPGVGHSFMNDHEGLLWRLARYTPLRAFHDPPTEARAWGLLLDFFDRHLGASPPAG